MIPQISIILPIRSRTTFTTNALASLITNSTRKDHQIILVIDKTPLAYEIEKRPNKYEKFPNILREDEEGMNRVDKWIDSHSYLFDKYNIDIITAKGDRDSCWLDHKRVAFVVEEGRKQVKHDWIIGYADEDLVFPRCWDEVFWRYMSDKDPMKYCVVPSLLTPFYMNTESDVKNADYAWLLKFIKEQKEGTWMDIPMPFSDQRVFGSTLEERKYRIKYSKFEDYIRRVAMPCKVDMERCGVRKDGPSNPFFISRKLADSVGGWSMEGPKADEFSLDARFDYRLYLKEVTKLMPRDCFVLHTKCNLYIDDEVDRTWGSISISPVSGSVTSGLM